MTDAGVQLAQSVDATCNALFSPQEGPQTLTLTPENKPQPNCVFPLYMWLSERRSWHAMESNVQFGFAASGTSMRQYTGNSTDDDDVILETTCMRDFPARITVGESFKAVMFATRGCSSGYMCSLTLSQTVFFRCG
ncbi:uncharacterized protein LOC129601120 [Paramacrobiotus metropolitanus]|uniref:uncharacterized protein LOC129601120 n=1 Tax=Paramacrobiotus metropolitanus TaxID=2943436 RepID=UPI002445C8E7|nr:uncharacterized protein LOC129601120 [Paramacrobiotus metropolitanus]